MRHFLVRKSAFLLFSLIALSGYSTHGLAAETKLTADVQPARLIVQLDRGLLARSDSGQPLIPLTLYFSDWTGPRPAVAASAYSGEVGASCKAAHLANGYFDATVDVAIKDQPSMDGYTRLVPGTGQIQLHLRINGTLASGNSEGSFNGVPLTSFAHGGIAYEVEYKGVHKAVRLWLPASSEVRGILIWGNGAGSDNREWAVDPTLQAFAAANHLALVGTAWFGREIQQGEGALLENAFKAFAKVSGHAEIENAPVLFTGHSNGGAMAYEFNAWRPSRVIAFTVYKGGFYESYDNLSAEALANPAVLSAGEVDESFRVAAVRRLYDTNRPKGAPWSLVVEQGMNHRIGASPALFLITLQRTLEQRLDSHASALHGPVKLKPVDTARGWLADNTSWKSGFTTIAPVAANKLDPARSSWLIDEDAAVVYRGLTSYSNPLKLARAGKHGPVYRRDEPAVFECTDFGNTEWKKIQVYDGAKLLGELRPAHTSLTVAGPHRTGAHAAVLVGTLKSGGQRTSLPIEWVVAPDGIVPDNAPAD